MFPNTRHTGSIKQSSGWEIGQSEAINWMEIIQAAEMVGRAKEAKLVKI